ncbi:MAG: hypothetical protein IJY39_00770 [Clostridia bacterium]|nr:hypothetical protein [Clostridia bacterium]
MAGLILSGVVSVKQVKLTFTTESLEAVYDGTPLTNHKWDLSSGKLKDGHTLEIEFKGSQTLVGESANAIEITIFDELGADVTSDYDITYNFGSLKVNPRVIVISSEDAEKIYDGTPLKNNKYTLSSEHKGLVTGHTADITVSGKITNAGTATNTIEEVNIFDADGKDVTRNYQIIYKEGILRVDPITVVVTSASALKAYDGEPLTADSYTLSNDPLEGHQILVQVTGSILEIGKADNTISSVQVLDKLGQDVMDNYQIILNEGVLTVTDELTAEGSGESGGGGGGGSVGGGSGSGNQDSVIYSVFANTNGIMYLRTQSYGDYTGTGWNAAPVYEPLINDKYAASYLTAFAFALTNAETYQAEIVTHSQPYAMPYYLSPATDSIQKDDTLSTGDGKDGYSVKFFKYDDSIIYAETPYTAFEKSYRTFVYSNYRTIDSQTRAYMRTIIKAQGFSNQDPDIINKVALYIKNAATYNLKFDPALEESDNIAIAFLDQYKEGVCRHYATAATLLYRALGIPARYTVGALAETVENQWVDVTSDKLHAWVEVYVDGIGWIQVEVTGSAPGMSGNLSPGAGGGFCDGSCEGDCDGTCSGDGTSSSGNDSDEETEDENGDGSTVPGGNETYPKKELTLYPVTVQKMYDGTPLYPKYELNGFSDLAKMGYSYKVAISGEQIEVGVSESSIRAITIFDSMGNDVTNAFKLTLKPGKIHVYSHVVQFTSPSYTVTYNGQPFKTGYLSGGELREGDYYKITSTANVNVGLQNNSYTVRIYDSRHNDVTDIYYVNKITGTVAVEAIPITFKAGDATKKYDGTPLICNECTLTEGSLLQGHTVVSWVVAGSQTEIGRSENLIQSVRILDANGVDVTSNYAIEMQPGKLRVTAS